MEKGKQPDWSTSGKERHCYGVYFLGQNVMYFVTYLFLPTYLLMNGLSPISTAAILCAVKLWDAINDSVFGILMDKINFKKGGRFLPWLRISVIPVAFTTLMLFAIPEGFAEKEKLIWLAVAYILWDTCYTMCDAPAYAMLTTLTSRQDERNHIMATARIYSNLGTILSILAGNLLVSEAVGLSFTTAALTGALFAVPCMLLVCFFGKEHVHVAEADHNKGSAYGVKTVIHYLAKNKYLLIFYLGFLLQQAMNTMLVVVMFACFYFFNSALLATVVSGLSYAAALAAGFAMPWVLKRFNKFRVFMWASAVYAAACVALWAIGPIFVPHLIFVILRGCAFGVISIMRFMFTPDCAEYGQYKTGTDARGITFSIQTLACKLEGTIVSVLSLAVLGVCGWVSVEAPNFAVLAEMNIAQTSVALDGLWAVYTLLPAVGAVLALLVWSQYRLRNMDDIELMTKYNNKEISREECDSKLSRRY